MAAPAPPQRKWDFDRVFRMLLAAAAVVGLFLLLRYLSDVLIPFAAALLLAYLLNPIVNALESKFHRRIPAVFVTVSGCGIVLFVLALVLFQVGSSEIGALRDLTMQFVRTPTKDDVQGFREAFERYVQKEDNPVVRKLLRQVQDYLASGPAQEMRFREDFAEYVQDFEARYGSEGEGGRAGDLEVLRTVQSRIHPGDPFDLELRESLERIREAEEDPRHRALILQAQRKLNLVSSADVSMTSLLERGLRYVAPTLVNLFSGTLSLVLGLTGLVVVLLYLVFLLVDYPIYVKMWHELLPPRQKGDILGFIDEFGLAMSRYFRGQFIVAMLVGVLFAIGFAILGLRMAVLLGLGIGLLNMVPYLQIVGMVPALLLGFVKSLEAGQPLWLGPLLVLVVFAVVQLIQDGLLVPKILGKSVGLRPVLILLGIFIWGKLLGFLGLLLAIPLTCLGLAYYRRFVLGDRSAKAIQDEGA